MARTIKPDEYAEKRNEILDVVQRLIYTKGYEQMTIQDVLGALSISKGAFYHYFDSKMALLEAMIERTIGQAEAITRPIVQNPELSALEKLQQYFSAVSAWKTTQTGYVIALMRVWFADENAIVRQKINSVMIQRIAPLFNNIIHQGIEEGVFDTPFPDQAGQVFLSIMFGMGDTIANLMFESAWSDDPQKQNEKIVTTYETYVVAVERMLGAPPGSLFRLDAEIVQVWIDAIRNQP